MSAERRELRESTALAALGTTSAMAALATALMLGCASARSGSAPVLDGMAPDSVMVAPGSAVEITLSGSGFGREGNVVRFGNAVLRGIVATDDGRRITFVVPDAIESGGEAPLSRVITGTYPVRVETSQGTSNVLMLRVFR